MVLLTCLWDPIKIELTQPKEPSSLLGSLASFAWPLVTVTILCLYRVPLSQFLTKISGRATEIGIGSWASIKLPEVKEAPANPISVIRELETDSWEKEEDEPKNAIDHWDISESRGFHTFDYSTGPSEYISIDLGHDRQWITSRLFIFAVMWQRMKVLKCIVLTGRDNTRRFIGTATPNNVRWALAANQPWLEVAYAQPTL